MGAMGTSMLTQMQGTQILGTLVCPTVPNIPNTCGLYLSSLVLCPRLEHVPNGWVHMHMLQWNLNPFPSNIFHVCLMLGFSSMNTYTFKGWKGSPANHKGYYKQSFFKHSHT